MKYRKILCIVTDLSTSLTVSGAANNSVVNLTDGPVVLVCHTGGHPLITYRWLDLKSNQTTDGCIYTIKTAGKYRLQCTASNDVTFANGSVVPHSVSARYSIIAESGMSTSAKLTHSQCTYTRYIVSDSQLYKYGPLGV